jgi:hypothetical protein
MAWMSAYIAVPNLLSMISMTIALTAMAQQILEKSYAVVLYLKFFTLENLLNFSFFYICYMVGEVDF